MDEYEYRVVDRETSDAMRKLLDMAEAVVDKVGEILGVDTGMVDQEIIDKAKSEALRIMAGGKD